MDLDHTVTKSNFTKTAILCTLAILPQGCANKSGYVQMYMGEEVTPNLKAVIRGVYGYRDGSLANEMIRIVEINGRKVPHQWGVAEGANTVSGACKLDCVNA